MKNVILELAEVATPPAPLRVLPPVRHNNIPYVPGALIVSLYC